MYLCITGLQILIVFDVTGGTLLDDVLQFWVRQVLNLVGFISPQTLCLYGLLQGQVTFGDLYKTPNGIIHLKETKIPLQYSLLTLMLFRLFFLL